MRRREFITLFGSAATWPLAARAQTPGRVQRVGFVWIGAAGPHESIAGLRRGLEERGYVLGRDLVLEERHADGNAARVPSLVADLLALNVDVLATPGTLISFAAKRATATVPIVFVSANPVEAGLVTSLARPGGNLTGLSVLSADYSAKWPQLLLEAVPRLHRLAVLYNPDTQAPQVERMRAAAQVLKLELTALSGRPMQLDESLAALAPASVDGFIVCDDPFLETTLPRLIAVAAERRLPALYGWTFAVKQGGLMSYSADFFEIWRQAAGYVDRVLKGVRPADLPVEQATRFTLKINLKTAAALGLDIPPMLLVRADEVIE
jgi:putative ABC transport system substrate-binding protein